MDSEHPVEIERRYLVLRLPWEPHGMPQNKGVRIRQWYLTPNKIEINDGIICMGRHVSLKVSEKKWIPDVAKIIEQSGSAIRVRIVEEEAVLCIKGEKMGIVGSEFEWNLSDPSWFEQMLAVSEYPSVEKRRWEIEEADGHIWELDIFEGANEGLRIAEIELSDENEEFVIPNWVGKEVTSDWRLCNQELAKNPISKWN